MPPRSDKQCNRYFQYVGRQQAYLSRKSWMFFRSDGKCQSALGIRCFSKRINARLAANFSYSLADEAGRQRISNISCRPISKPFHKTRPPARTLLIRPDKPPAQCTFPPPPLPPVTAARAATFSRSRPRRFRSWGFPGRGFRSSNNDPAFPRPA